MSVLRNLRKAVVAAVISAGAVGSAKADIVIDDFSSPTPGITYLINLDTPNNTTFTTSNVQPGINRSVTLNVTTPVVANSMGGDINGPLPGGGNSGIFTMSLNNSSAGTAMFNYTFTSPINFIPNVPMGGAVGSLQYLSSADAGFASTVPLDFTIITATGTLSFSTTMNLTGTFTPTNVPLSSFTGTGDLTQVTGMTIMITGGQAADVALDSINITTPQAPIDPIPAPPAAVLALLAIPSLGLRHRWKKNDVALT